MTQSSAYYNEQDPLKAETLREAILAGAVAPGDVDERSIKDVQPSDVMGYTQCHWFAGGGFWSLALRFAEWPDSRPVWTGSCPCPSFSAAGKGAGFDDPRHLWPDWFRLIRECRPPVVFGEQVNAAVRFGWLDLVQSDLEAETYAVGKIVFGAHSVGAPHIRQRLYFVADAESARGRSDIGAVRGSAAEGLRGTQGADERRAIVGAGHLGNRSSTLHAEHAAGDGRIERRPEPGGGSVASGRGPGECADTADGRREPWPCDVRRGAGVGMESTEPFSEPCDDGSGAVCGECPNPDGGQSGDGDVQRGGQHGLFAADCGTGFGSDTEDAERRRPGGEAYRGRRTAEAGGPSTAGDGAYSLQIGCGAGSPSEPERQGGDALAKHRGFAGDGLHTLSPRPQGHGGDERAWRGPGWLDPELARSVAASGATRGFWRDCDWWYGRDGKYRPIEPGVFPLASKYPARVGILRLAGDAIVVSQAQAFIEVFMGKG